MVECEHMRLPAQGEGDRKRLAPLPYFNISPFTWRSSQHVLRAKLDTPTANRPVIASIQAPRACLQALKVAIWKSPRYYLNQDMPCY